MATKTRSTARATVGQEKEVKKSRRATVAKTEPEPVMLDKDQAMIAILMEMQRQSAEQTKMLASILERQGSSIEATFVKPPTGTVVRKVESGKDAATEMDHGPQPMAVVADDSVLPGQKLPDGRDMWKPWTPQDVERFPKRVIYPYPLPNLVWPELDDDGKQKIRLIVNDLECWLTVGEPNDVSEFFANVYDSAYEMWKNNEKFKRTGGRGPWVRGGPHGENTWTYRTDVISFGMDEDGRPIGIDRSIWEVLPASASFEGLEQYQ